MVPRLLLSLFVVWAPAAHALYPLPSCPDNNCKDLDDGPPPWCPEDDCDLSLAQIDIHQDKALTVRVDNLANVSASAWLWAHDPKDPGGSKLFYIDIVKPGGSVWVDVDGFAVTDLVLEEGESCKGLCLDDNGATVTEAGAVLWW